MKRHTAPAAAIAVIAALSARRRHAAADGSAMPCRSAITTGPIPAWARAGFSDKVPRMPHAVGRSGAIAALVFGYPLQSPPDAKRNNKILWVSRTPAQPQSAGAAPHALHIRAQRMRGTTRIGRPVERSVARGPGPSIIDLPAPGCWRLTLTWSHGRDTLDLRYS